jgi:hypothetical protein
MSSYEENNDEIETYYYKDPDGSIQKGQGRVTEGAQLARLSWEQPKTLYRVKGISKRGNVEVSAPTDSRTLLENKLRFWKKTGYYKKLIIQVRHVPAWEDEKENN